MPIVIVVVVTVLAAAIWFWSGKWMNEQAAKQASPALPSLPAGSTAAGMNKEIPEGDATRVQTVTGITTNSKGLTPLMDGNAIVGVATGTSHSRPTGPTPKPIIVGPSQESGVTRQADPPRR